MSAMSGAEPEELDEFVRGARAITERQRIVARHLERVLDALGSGRRELGPAADASTRSLRAVIGRFDALAGEVAGVAAAFRAADRVLARLTGASAGTVAPGSGGGGTILPTPDVSVEWSWPPEWTIERRWGDDGGYAEVEVGLGVRAEGGAGVDVTREAIRAGAYAEARIGAWAIGAIGTAIGPFAAHATGELFAGARSRGEALLHVGRDGARARLGGEVFAGAKADGDLRGGIGPIQAGAHGGVSYGAGVTGDADIDLSLERIGGRVKFGGALGLGWEGGFEYYVEPGWIADGIAVIGSESVDVAARAVETGVGAGVDLAGDAVDVAGDAMSAGGSVIRSLGGLF